MTTYAEGQGTIGSNRTDYSAKGHYFVDYSEYFAYLDQEEGVPHGTNALRHRQPFHVDPLTSIRALVMSGNHYSNGEHMTRERIDDVIKKMKADGQIPESSSFESDLARRALAGGLKSIYEPIDEYIRLDIHGSSTSPRMYRSGYNPDDLIYQGLHEYLMENHISREYVENYVRMRREDPKSVEKYERSREYHMFDKYNSFKYTATQNPLYRTLGTFP